jgi:3-oxoadipate enol-lactonase
MLVHEVAGSGPTVLLLHSGVCDRRQWNPQWEGLAGVFTGIRPDLRGFGETPLDGSSYSNADDVAKLLKTLGADNAAVVGSSYGGRVALEMAVLYPDLVRQLVLLCPAYGGLAHTAAVDAFAAEEDRLLERGDVDGAVELNVRTWLGPLATEAVRDLVTSMQRRAFEVQLAADGLENPPEPAAVDVDLDEVNCPTVIVSGGQDVDHFQNICRHLGAAITDAELIEWSDVAHLPNLEVPDRTTAFLVSVLS